LEPKHTTEDALFATLLRGNNEQHRETIRSCLSYRRPHKTMNLGLSKPSDELTVGGGVAGSLQGTTIEGGAEEYDEVLTMISVGNGMDGHEGILHGGFIAMILDEVMGMAGGLYAHKSTFTASLKLDYRKPISTPGMILVKGKTEKQRGRKLWVNGSIEDGRGLVFAEAISPEPCKATVANTTRSGSTKRSLTTD